MKKTSWLFIALLAFPGYSFSRVKNVSIEKRSILGDGIQFGDKGTYEQLEGTITFTFDPYNTYNQNITDIKHGQTNQDGLIEAKAKFMVWKPTELIHSNGIALVEVSNRGRKASISYLNPNPTNSDWNLKGLGDGMLMRYGYTIVWVGWQFDVPDINNHLTIEVGKAITPGKKIKGLVRSDWVIDKEIYSLGLGHGDMIGYPVSDPNSEQNILTKRKGRNAERQVVSREDWDFGKLENGQLTDSRSHIYSSSGFAKGFIYELVYESENPDIVGMGPAVIRDIGSYIKYNSNCIFPADQTIATGVSQTGRFLRYYVYKGFNTDEKNRKVYDGIMSMTAGAGRGSFNHRFAQPSRDAHRYRAFFYPTDIFPFTSQTQTIDNLKDGLFNHQHNNDHLPKILHINTGYEYWGRTAALIHSDVKGSKDILPLENERIYAISSGQHFVGRVPDHRYEREKNVYYSNPLQFKSNYKALFRALSLWVKEETSPPPSQYPNFKNGNLISFESI
jgi:hypothetical protein